MFVDACTRDIQRKIQATYNVLVDTRDIAAKEGELASNLAVNLGIAVCEVTDALQYQSVSNEEAGDINKQATYVLVQHGQEQV